MDEQRHQNQGYSSNDRDRGGRGRHRHGRHGGGGGYHHGGGGGRGNRAQRPLLTSSTNAAGLTLIALVLLFQGSKETQFQSVQMLGWAVMLFGVSAIVSYFAQRVRPVIFEKISDVLFLAGLIVVLWVSLCLSSAVTIM